MKKLFIIGMAALLVVAFTVPAMAKVKVYGMVFVDAFYLDRDRENSIARGLGQDAYTITRIDLPNYSRIGATWTNEDNVGMRIELGVGDGAGAGGVKLRLAYGWWDVTPVFQIMVGQSTTPFSQLLSAQALGGDIGNGISAGYGEFYSGRFPQIRGTFRFGKVARFEVALVDSHKGTFGPWADAQDNTKIPRIDIGVPIHLGPISLYPSFLWQRRNVDIVAPVGAENTLTTMIGSLGIHGGFGPFGFKAEGNYGRNWGNSQGWFGVSPAAGLARAELNAATGKINNADTYGFWFDLFYKFGPITPHVIYGQMKTKRDNAAGAKQEVRTQSIGVSANIVLAKGFSLMPELMWYDDGDTSTAGSASTNNGKYALYGVRFMVNF